MTKVFIAGSISIKTLDAEVKRRIDNIVASEHTVIVGDADGADSSIQDYLVEKGAKNAVVYCSGATPRNNIGKWRVKAVSVAGARPGSRSFFTAKDVEMANDADFGLMIWDSKSTGTLRNVIELLRQKKKSVVFVNKSRTFETVGDVGGLERLVNSMTEPAKRTADAKIHWRDAIAELKHAQAEMF
jgi:hypothetical protein